MNQFDLVVTAMIALGSLTEVRYHSVNQVQSVVEEDQIGAICFGHRKNNPIILYKGMNRYIQVRDKIFNLNTRTIVKNEDFLEEILDINIENDDLITLNGDNGVIVIDQSERRVYTEAA